MSLAEARQLGADMFFGEKYIPESVRVVQVDGFSKELCGGTHVAATGQIGSFRILSESSIGTGLRRIEAVTGEAAEELSRVGWRRCIAPLSSWATARRTSQHASRPCWAASATRSERPGMGDVESAATRIDAAGTLQGSTGRRRYQGRVQRFADADAATLRTLADDLRGMTGRFVLVAAGGGDGQPALLVAASKDLAGEGFDSAAIIRSAAPLIGGGGGGRPDLAQAGGRDGSRLDEALREAGRLALEALARIETS